MPWDEFKPINLLTGSTKTGNWQYGKAVLSSDATYGHILTADAAGTLRLARPADRFVGIVVGRYRASEPGVHFASAGVFNENQISFSSGESIDSDETRRKLREIGIILSPAVTA